MENVSFRKTKDKTPGLDSHRTYPWGKQTITMDIKSFKPKYVSKVPFWQTSNKYYIDEGFL